MKSKLLLCLVFITSFTFGQLENNNWYFSPTNKGVLFDINTNVPTVTTCHTSLTNLHGCGVATNPTNGTVLFYTDGQYVFDAGNFQMPNGYGLFGGISCAEKGTIVQVPNSCDSFFVFTNDANSPIQGSIHYSIVNMTLPGNGTVGQPKGDVEPASKNTLVMDSSTECFTIVPNMIGHNYWLIVPVNATSYINVYSITATGIVYANTFNTGIVFNSSMAIKYSKLAGKVAYASVVENDPALLIDFNDATGVLSNTAIIGNTPIGTCTNIYNGWHDVEFSPDGTKLYLSKYRMYSPASAGRIYQYDLSIPGSPLTMVFNNPTTDIQKTVTGMETGPDGKIYFIYFNTSTNDDRFIGCIGSPNLAGNLCNINASALNLGISQGNNSRFSTPAFFNKDIFPIIKLDPCSGTSITENSIDNLFSISPNPTNGIVNISLNVVSEKTIFTVSTILGEKIYSENRRAKNKEVIDLSKFSEGIYFITLETEKGRSTKKMIFTK